VVKGLETFQERQATSARFLILFAHWEKHDMNRTLRPKIESLESKALMSTLTGALTAAGFHELPFHDRSPHVGKPVPNAPGMTMSLTTNQSVYTEGQKVVMTLTITNNSARAQTILVGPSVDAFVITQKGKVVWRSDEHFTPMFIRHLTLQPGKSYSVSADWTASGSGTFAAHNTAMANGPTAQFAVMK
jgi:Intracellular proteinase inhibitor